MATVVKAFASSTSEKSVNVSRKQSGNDFNEEMRFETPTKYMQTATQQMSHQPTGRSRSVGRQPENLGCVTGGTITWLVERSAAKQVCDANGRFNVFQACPCAKVCMLKLYGNFELNVLWDAPMVKQINGRY